MIHIAPTKALVNDLYARLMDYLEIRLPGAVQRYTGDHHDFRVSDGAFCLIATPEALDSLQLMRPKDLTSVRAIVVDEIHLLHGSARGQQLRHIIDRIRQASASPRSTRDNFQIVGMTATIDQVDEVRTLWFGSESRVVSNGNPRDIDFDFIDVPEARRGELPRERAAALRFWIETSGVAKVLVFTNSRNAAHALAAALSSALSGTRWPVHLHIGILAAAERERVEAAMRSDRFGICVATSTLEIGIDIGDIDVIVLADPPISVSAFLQRIGRGNRRSDICRVVALRDSPDIEAVFSALLDCAQRGELDDVHEYDRPSVHFQQVLSLTWRAVRNGHALTRKDFSTGSGGMDHADVVDDMLETGTLRNVNGSLIPSDEWMDAGDKRRIHTVIAGGSGVPVIDTSRGEVVATAGPAHSGGVLYIGGKFRQLHGGADGSMYLEKVREGQRPLATLPTTRGRRGLSRVVVWAMARRSGIDPAWWHWEGNRLITWGGTTYNRLLASLIEHTHLAEKCVVSDLSVDGINRRDAVDLPRILQCAEAAHSGRTVPRSVAKRFLEGTRYMSALSPALQAREERNAIPFPGFLRWINACKGIRLPIPTA